MPLRAPTSVEGAHQELIQLLIKVQHMSGKTGAIAEELARKLRVHAEKEETIVMPLLGLLPDLTGGKSSFKWAKRASGLYSEMKRGYSGMLNEHREILKLLSRLKKVAAEEGHLTAVRFAETLEQHAREEDEILYPAALLAGRLVSKEAKSD
jgi:iron-sulfur cluster repair protein YtfE (RIC family)